MLYFDFVFLPAHAEADAFFCFTHLMGEIRDNFLKTLDDSACGIGKFQTAFSSSSFVLNFFVLFS